MRQWWWRQRRRRRRRKWWWWWWVSGNATCLPSVDHNTQSNEPGSVWQYLQAYLWSFESMRITASFDRKLTRSMKKTMYWRNEADFIANRKQKNISNINMKYRLDFCHTKSRFFPYFLKFLRFFRICSIFFIFFPFFKQFQVV